VLFASMRLEIGREGRPGDERFVRSTLTWVIARSRVMT
jgi:hypothetical protein